MRVRYIDKCNINLTLKQELLVSLPKWGLEQESVLAYKQLSSWQMAKDKSPGICLF